MFLSACLSFCGDSPQGDDVQNNGKDFSIAEVASFYDLVPKKPIVGVILGDHSISLFLGLQDNAYLERYIIERTTHNDDMFEDISDRMADNAYSDMGLEDGTYQYKVTAIYSDGKQEKRAEAVHSSKVLFENGKLSIL